MVLLLPGSLTRGFVDWVSGLLLPAGKPAGGTFRIPAGQAYRGCGMVFL